MLKRHINLDVSTLTEYISHQVMLVINLIRRVLWELKHGFDHFVKCGGHVKLYDFQYFSHKEKRISVSFKILTSLNYGLKHMVQ